LQFSACKYEIDHHVAIITLNRPDKGNAFNEQMILELTQIVNTISDDIHVLCIRAAGKHFCTGADLVEMQNNLNDPMKLALFMQALHNLNVPVVAAVNGAAFAGAIGLLANCDIVIAQSDAVFCLSEVKLGLVPAVISPYVIEALGIRHAKRLMLSAEKFSAESALQVGLVHQIVPPAMLDDNVKACVQNLLTNGPKALRAVKKLCREVLTIKADDRPKYTADLLMQIRNTPEAQSRLKDFFEKKHV
jgi:methylglutaconyl-CoA hydratase